MGTGASATSTPSDVSDLLSSLSEPTRDALTSLPAAAQTELLAAISSKKLVVAVATSDANADANEASSDNSGAQEVSKKKKKKASTAQGVAKSRLAETMMPPEKRLFEDKFATLFVEGAEASFKKIGIENIFKMYEQKAPGMNRLLILRTKCFDDVVMKAVVEDECKQLLVLGAGYDMRGLRLALPEDVRVYELDQPDVQAQKIEMLAQSPPSPVAAASAATSARRPAVWYVPIDFNTQSLKEELTKVDFDSSMKTVVLMEGVTQYVPAAATEQTLRDLADVLVAGSTLAISYIDQDTFIAPGNVVGEAWGAGGDKLATFLAAVGQMGEPWISGWSSDSFAKMALGASDGGLVVKDERLPSELSEQFLVPLGRAAPPECRFDIERWAVLEKQ